MQPVPAALQFAPGEPRGVVRRVKRGPIGKRLAMAHVPIRRLGERRDDFGLVLNQQPRHPLGAFRPADEERIAVKRDGATGFARPPQEAYSLHSISSSTHTRSSSVTASQSMESL